MRAAIYTRVSTLSQLDGCSLEMQEKLAINYCVGKNFNVVKIYRDEAVSGMLINRLAFSKMLQDIKQGKIDVVITYKLDRIGRSQKELLQVIEDVFIANSVEFISLTENIDTSTPLGRATIGMLAVLAQLERDQIKERVAMGKIGRAMRGLPMTWTNRFCPLGYDYIDGRYVKNKDIDIVKLIFEKHRQGKTSSIIAKELNNENIKNKKWYKSTVYRILNNPVYFGKISWRGQIYDGLHESIN